MVDAPDVAVDIVGDAKGPGREAVLRHIGEHVAVALLCADPGREVDVGGALAVAVVLGVEGLLRDEEGLEVALRLALHAAATETHRVERVQREPQQAEEADAHQKAERPPQALQVAPHLSGPQHQRDVFGLAHETARDARA